MNCALNICDKLFLQRDTTLTKRETNVAIHKKLLTQILEYEHANVKVSNNNNIHHHNNSTMSLVWSLVMVSGLLAEVSLASSCCRHDWRVIKRKQRANL